MKILIVTSATSDRNNLQASIVYLTNIVSDFDILDLSGKINYYDPPEKMLSPLFCENWMSSRVFYKETWLDDYFTIDSTEYDVIIYSALFSPDILVHGRHFVKYKEKNSSCVGMIGGGALHSLNTDQLNVLNEVFDEVSTSSFDKRVSLDYSIISDFIRRKSFITISSGNGCYYGKCRFCNSSVSSYHCKPISNIIDEFRQIACLNSDVKDVMLSSDSITEKTLLELSTTLEKEKIVVPYNVMMRAEKWVSKKLARKLNVSGCTDVFLGIEALDDDILKILRKGIMVDEAVKAIASLSEYVKVIIGLILFIPSVTEVQLKRQLVKLESILPYIDKIEPEVLSIVQGSEFSKHPNYYGIKLWSEKSIDESWCFGLSPNIPWTFSNSSQIDIWFKYYDDLKELTKGFVEEHYWNSIDYIQEKFK